MTLAVIRGTQRQIFRTFQHTRLSKTIWPGSDGMRRSRLASTLPKIPVLEAITRHDPNSAAVIHSDAGQIFTYGRLVRDVVAVKHHISGVTNNVDLEGQRVAFMAENGYDFVVQFLAIMAHQAVALPLAPAFPKEELHYILNNSEARMILSTTGYAKKMDDVSSLNLPQRPLVAFIDRNQLPAADDEDIAFHHSDLGRGGLMLYTSGTTNRPKGVILNNATVTAQAKSLIEAWKYSPKDLLLHMLPLHHIHGLVNGVFTPLLAGSSIEFLFPFNPRDVWHRFAAPFLPARQADSKRPVTMVTAVPTIYDKLLAAHSSLDPETQDLSRTAVSPANLRLCISGSAALTPPIKAAWTALSSGNVLLERYGMTETGMALSCGLDSADKVDGSVGWPLPSVELRLVDPETSQVIPESEDTDDNDRDHEGEIQVRGPTILREYWNNPAATAAEFVADENGGSRWFKTGDIAARRFIKGSGKSSQLWAQGPMYFIRGRKSMDILKSGGEKVSALEVENALLSLPEVSEAAVVGVPSQKWGQKIIAIVVLSSRNELSAEKDKRWGPLDMRRALRDKLARYKIPHDLKVVQDLSRNAMGKVNKKVLVAKYFPSI